MATRKVSSDGKTEKRFGLVCTVFSLEFYQGWPSKPTKFSLQARAEKDSGQDTYSLSTTVISDEEDLIVLLLRKIAANNGEPGWTFDALFDLTAKSGLIIG